MKIFRMSLFFLTLCVAVIGLTSISLAQGIEPVEPLNLTNEPVILEFSTGSAGPPTIEPLTDGRMTFRVAGVGEVSGTLLGSISVRVSEVTPMPSPAFHAVSVMFTIETEDGMIEGYYAGSFHRSEQGDEAAINASGLILSVSGAYADLYLAEVFVTSAVQFVDGRAIGESGTMTIAAR